MSGADMAMHALACHPASRSPAVRSVQAGLSCEGGDAVTLNYIITGDVGRIGVPHSRAPRRADGLWRRTCCECFVMAGDGAYLEFNFSPSGEWAAYAFRGYREPAPLPPDSDPRIAVVASDGKLTLEATIAAGVLPRRPWRIGLSAVVEDGAGVVTYWALRHAPGKPDFHHETAFALAL
jgi:hypothetical protein